MKVNELLDMKFGDVLDEFCFCMSPECGYVYGIATWDDVAAMFDEYDLEDEYCFQGDHIIAYPMEVDFEADVLDTDRLRNLLDYLGIKQREQDGGA